MCQAKKKEEDSLVLKITLMHRYKDLKTTLKIAEENWLPYQKQYSQLKDQRNKNNQKTKMGRKKNMDTINNKQEKSHMKKIGQGYEREAFSEKLNLFW